MDKTEISKKLRFIKEGVHENEYMEVLAICNIYEREIERIKRTSKVTYGGKLPASPERD